MFLCGVGAVIVTGVLAVFPPALFHRLDNAAYDILLRAARTRPPSGRVVIGHTDTMGTQQANYGLGLKRAMMIRNILVTAGLDGSTIEATSVGELDPLVKTADETPEPRNRRVDIAVR